MKLRLAGFACTLLIVPLTTSRIMAAPEDDAVRSAAEAFNAGQPEQALELASQAAADFPNSVAAQEALAEICARLERHAESVAAFDRVLELDPRRAAAYEARGSQHFMLGHFKQSLADFDRGIALRPDQGPGHWKRGITCYYAGRYDEGRQQFEGYQTVDDNDVENAVWRYLCMARTAGVEKARADLLKIKADTRVPMMQVYAMFAGKAAPDDVLAAARQGNPSESELNDRLFYAHLYVGLFHEADGDKRQALEHIAQAEKHKIGHYMWEVARVHAQLLKASK